MGLASANRSCPPPRVPEGKLSGPASSPKPKDMLESESEATSPPVVSYEEVC